MSTQENVTQLSSKINSLELENNFLKEANIALKKPNCCLIKEDCVCMKTHFADIEKLSDRCLDSEIENNRLRELIENLSGV